MIVRARVSVPFAVTTERVYQYLRNPKNRPAWQSSLRAVAEVRGAGEAGTTWLDVTWPGLRPSLVVTADEPGRRWAEHGSWRAAAADLELLFTPSASGCLVTAEVVLRGPLVGALRPVLGPAIRADLARAARLLAE